MKIKKTWGDGIVKSTAFPKGKTGQSTQSENKVSTGSEDTVSLSADALAASEMNRASAVSSKTATSGPLPDPTATSQAILEKELTALFREIYL